MQSLVTQCIALEKKPSFEDQWIQEIFDRIRAKYSLPGRMETDLFVSRRLDGNGKSAQLKVRYWRTRRHLPKNREQCIRLGRALELSDVEMVVLLQRYYDSSDCEFRRNCQDSEQHWIHSCHDPLYHARRKFVNKLLEQYIQRLSGRILHGKLSQMPRRVRFHGRFFIGQIIFRSPQGRGIRPGQL